MKQNQAEIAGQGVHQFHFSKHVATWRWAMTTIPMTVARAQQLAKRHGKDRFGPQADLIITNGLPFMTLTEAEPARNCV